MVALATLKTDIWKVFYDHLQTGTYAISTDNIFSAYPDEESVTYPMVIIYPPATSTRRISQGNYANTVKEVNFTVPIEVYHNSAKNVKSLIDEVENKIRTGMDVFTNNSLYNIQFESSDYDWWIESNKKVHRCTIEISGRYVKK